ncbi:MAG: hypothetical protein RIB60_11790 [Phycisphaerales bacterium]
METRVRSMVLALLICLAASLGLARADVVTLKDGRVIEGVITKETRGAITIDTLVANIRTSEEIPRFRIASIERKPVPDDFFTPNRPERDGADKGDGTRDRPVRRGRDDEPETHFVVVPIEGTIGEAVTASGIAEAFNQADRRSIEHIVFTIDSPGGYLFEANQILDVLAEHDDQFVYHAYIVDGAISAASVFAAGADHIYVAPDARLGGAVAYTSDHSTGATEVDAKLNSIWASSLAARAESKGHSGHAFRAMVEQSAELWLSESGELRAVKVSPADEQLDGRRSILTLRASQMVRASMAEQIDEGIDQIGALRSIEGWGEVPRIGARAMAAASKRRGRLIDRHAELTRNLELALESAADADPSSGRYYVDSDTGRFTGGSMVKWQQACDAAMGRWNDVRSVLLAMADLDSDARDDGALHLITPEDQGNELFGRVEERMSWLQQNRYRTTPP